MVSQDTASVRIVSVDHYMSKPDPQFDVCYSQFRGTEVKQVPVIRLFGTTTDGTHSCVHLHGVFPYFYIPYEGSTADRLGVDKRIYQLASALDKAINVSLARSSSTAVHIFKIVLVKGIPIYGYHRNAHNYLKIYMYNPMLVRNATQLLMNGAIPSAMPQVHETHVPYVLQFFIDYNLYGMSFMHLSAKNLRRRKPNAPEGAPAKMSTSEYEIDAFAADILNREPEPDDGEFANPGIASIWKEEQNRRRLCGLGQPESMNLSQDGGSGNEVVTESDRFYRALLASKLATHQTTATSAEEDSRRKLTSAYPSEVGAEGEVMLDASYIDTHARDGGGHSNESLYASQISYHFDPSLEVDEEKIVSMSQNTDATLQEEDFNLLEIMRELEENERNNYEGDCLLAPLTQQSSEPDRSVRVCSVGALNVSQTNRRLNASLCGDLEAICLMATQPENNETGNAQDDSFDSDDEFLLDLTQKQNTTTRIDEALDDSGDEDLLAGACIPQLDGADELSVSRTSKRNRRNSKESTSRDISLVAKRIRIDLTQPATKRSLTPRKVTFAPSPPSADDNANERSECMRKEFEQHSPHTLKQLAVRLPKLSLIKKSILFKKATTATSASASASSPKQTPLKNLRVRLTKLDPGAYELSKKGEKVVAPANRVADRLQQAYDYDRRNNFNPLEGCSKFSANRVRKSDQQESTANSWQPKPKRSKPEEQQDIEVVLSERFKNIIRLSPKVLIKPLAMVADCSTQSVPKHTVSVAPDKIPETESEVERSDEVVQPRVAPIDKPIEDLNQPDQATSVVADVSNEESLVSVAVTTDSAQTVTIDITDDEPVEKVPSVASSSDTPPMVIIADLSDDLLEADDGIESIIALGNPREPKEREQEDVRFRNTASDVPIAIQLDGVIELMDADDDKEDAGGVPVVHTEPEEEEDPNILSFCENTMLCEVDEFGSDSDESYRVTWNAADSEEDADTRMMISLAARPPTRQQACQAIESFEIPAVVNATPFYSNPADVTGRREVGHTVLHIRGNSVNDLEEFRSTITGLRSVKHLRYENLRQTYEESIGEVLGPVGAHGPNADRMKELLASESSVTITHCEAPPSRGEACAWIDERIRKRQTDPAASTAIQGDPVEQDSPIKVKKAGAIMTVGKDIKPPNALSLTTIDSESSLNLSVLLTKDDSKSTSNGGSTKDLVSKIIEMNTYGSPNPAEVSKESTTLSGYGARKKQQMLRSERARTNSTSRDPSQDPVDPEEVINSSQINENLMELADPIQSMAGADDSEQARKLKDGKPPTPSPSVPMASSDQSDLIEQSNANISTANTPHDNEYGFKVNYENLQEAKLGCEYNYLTILSIEIHVQTRGTLRSNPATDPIAAIFYRIHNDVPPDHPRASSVCGIIMNRELCGPDNGTPTTPKKYNQSAYVADVVMVAGERELYEKFLLLIAFWDPDIFTGYEIESVSWGYVIERGYALEMNLMKMLSRVPTAEKVHVSEEEQQELLEMHDYSAGLTIPGRILLDIWRLMRHEIALTSYTFENVAYHILHRRVPCHSYQQLSRLWNKPYSRWIVLDYYLERVNGNFEILSQLDLIGRTAELAKLFGIQFYEVLSRGSQFRVESMMLRIAKPRNFVSVSPTIQQRAHMRAPEYLPLIMEPNSRFYADPIIVLDFQSLYPSVIIAYNYCFSTCLGRIEHLAQSSEEFEFGASQLRVPPKMLRALVEKNLITFSPCGVAFVKKAVREGVLPRMLSEILNTRLMVKKSMKLHKHNSVLQRVLHSRQLGLKLIANVTYGYTAANFSGRMPCVEIGDSVVAKGRETLERAIKLVEGTERWGAKVVYGDTDSMFVLCPGRTKAEAFRIGEEIADLVTKENPPPVKLKLEKVYQPSILQTKKRYVGYMYETADQEKPTYEAKGIETVRRDGCPVVAKMLEKVLRILFETCDVSKVKQYTCRQFTKILEGRVNLQDFIFAKEFRGADGYKPGACVPALELSRKWKLTDPRREPRRGQRVPYVIVNGPPLVPLIRLVRSPDEVLANEGLKVNANYYISKAIIPPLNRCLLLIGADLNQWYNDLPRKTLLLHNTGGGAAADGVGKLVAKGSGVERHVHKKSTISQYFSTTNCIVDCGRQTQHGICKDCRQRPQYALLHVLNKMNKLERKLELTEKMCRSCCQRTFETGCVSLDCPVLFSLDRRMVEHKQTQYYRGLLEQFF